MITGFILEFILEQNTFDIQIHDTYFVIPYFYFLIVFAFIFGFLGGIYYLIQKLAKKRMNKILVFFHLVLTIISSLGILFPLSFTGYFNKPQRYYGNSDLDFINGVNDLNKIIVILSILFILAQLIFITNIIITLVKNKTRN